MDKKLRKVPIVLGFVTSTQPTKKLSSTTFEHTLLTQTQKLTSVIGQLLFFFDIFWSSGMEIIYNVTGIDINP